MDARTNLLKRIVENSDRLTQFIEGRSEVSDSLIEDAREANTLISEARELLADVFKNQARLEELRASLEEDMSWEELAELQSLVPYIDESDLELMEAAGVPEQVLLNNVVVTDEAIEGFSRISTKEEAKNLNALGPYMTLMERLHVGEEFSEFKYYTVHGALASALGNVRAKEIYAAYQKANVQSTEQAL